MATTFFAKKANNEGKVHIFVRVRQKRTGFDCRMGTNLFLDERVWNHIDDPVYLEKFKNNKIINDILLIMDDIFKKSSAMNSRNMATHNRHLSTILLQNSS